MSISWRRSGSRRREEAPLGVRKFGLHVARAFDDVADEDFGVGVDGHDDGGGYGLGESLVGYLSASPC